MEYKVKFKINLFFFLFFQSTYIFASEGNPNDGGENLTWIISLLALFVSFSIMSINFLNYRETNFNNRFNQLLTQHNKLHEQLESYINDHKNEYLSVLKKVRYNDSVSFLYKNNIFSPYMRFLYHMLKFVDRESLFMTNDKKKKYTSIIRSLITNDIMTFIAINSLNEEFIYYRSLLDKFDFFEHLSLNDLKLVDNYEPDYLSIIEKFKLENLVKDVIDNYFHGKIKKQEIMVRGVSFFPYWTMIIDLNKTNNTYYEKELGFIKFDKSIKSLINTLIVINFNYLSNKKPDYTYKYIVFDYKINDIIESSFLCINIAEIIEFYIKAEGNFDVFISLTKKYIKKYLKYEAKILEVNFSNDIYDAENYLRIDRYMRGYCLKTENLFNVLYYYAISDSLSNNRMKDDISIVKNRLNRIISNTYLYKDSLYKRDFNID
nr:putative phage abortive infection protein [Proteus mirabilis]